MKTIQAHVQPQAFSQSYPNLPANVGEVVAVDVTERLLSMSAKDLSSVQDNDWTSEFLIAGLIQHQGPRLIHVEESIKSFFGVGFLEEVTDQMLMKAREIRAESSPTTA